MTTDEQLEAAIINTALRNMVIKGWVDICTIDQVIKLLKSLPDTVAYKRLHLLHCVYFKDMPPEVRAAVPELITACLDGHEFDLDSALRPTTSGAVIDITPPKKGGGILAFLK